MDIQLAATIVIVAGATAYVLRSLWQSLNPTANGGCGSGCGKCAAPAEEKKRPGMIALEQVRTK